MRRGERHQIKVRKEGKCEVEGIKERKRFEIKEDNKKMKEGRGEERH